MRMPDRTQQETSMHASSVHGTLCSVVLTAGNGGELHVT